MNSRLFGEGRWLLVPILVLPAAICAQESEHEHEEPAAIVEIGGVPAWSLTGEGSNVSPTVAVEFTPIERWLEIEIGLTAKFSHGMREWDTDLLFKKGELGSRSVLEQLAG